jgi:hypothetical protein
LFHPKARILSINITKLLLAIAAAYSRLEARLFECASTAAPDGKYVLSNAQGESSYAAILTSSV